MDFPSIISLITSSPPSYALAILICVMLLAVFWFVGIPMFEENKKLREQNATLSTSLEESLTKLTSLDASMQRLLQANDEKVIEDVLRSITDLRTYTEHSDNAANISMETLHRTLQEVCDHVEKLVEVQRRHDSETALILSRYDHDLRAINDKLSQLVGAQWGRSSNKRGIN